MLSKLIKFREYVLYASLGNRHLYFLRSFVKIIVYADESGTHDQTGKQTGAECPTIGGYMAYPDDWIKFCDEWKAVLAAYNVPYFHFREFNDRDAAQNDQTSPYHGWDKDRRDSFLYDLAEVAGKQIPIGAMYWQKKHGEVLTDYKDYPYRPLIDWFFKGMIEALNERPYYSGKLFFYFDQSSDLKWKTEFTTTAEEYKKKGLRVAEIRFADKKVYPHWPLQAADMLAYRDRQIAVPRLQEQRPQTANVLDIILNRNLRPNGFWPAVTTELANDIKEKMAKFPSVRRVLTPQFGKR
jgi:hypothetical protein